MIGTLPSYRQDLALKGFSPQVAGDLFHMRLQKINM
jgi:hypothetical protein